MPSIKGYLSRRCCHHAKLTGRRSQTHSLLALRSELAVGSLSALSRRLMIVGVSSRKPTSATSLRYSSSKAIRKSILHASRCSHSKRSFVIGGTLPSARPSRPSYNSKGTMWRLSLRWGASLRPLSPCATSRNRWRWRQYTTVARFSRYSVQVNEMTGLMGSAEGKIKFRLCSNHLAGCSWPQRSFCDGYASNGEHKILSHDPNRVWRLKGE